ncbi:MAG TPA: M20/M25/M40 family metallo-hydrolase [Gemmatimonadaceae bacterium]|nr:M20/M25/M40 family metallo-hydrolase [Gemmatimonadaceae bacterium]
MKPDWQSASAETVSRLQAIIRFDTTNPPGNELPLALYLETALREQGIETTLFKPEENRAVLVGRIPGNGTKRPVILLAHMDVVGVERQRWSVDPFAGEVRDGYLYGRGAIDDKGMLAANLMTMLLLKRTLSESGGTLSRDVVFLATSDEEAGGEWGMGWLVKHHPEVLDAEFALNEGGRTRIIEGGQRYLAVQSAEKVSHVVTVTAHGSAGHAAIPLPDNAIFRLARALETLSRYVEPVMLTEITRKFFAQLAEIWPRDVEKKAMIDLVSADPKRTEAGASVLSPIPVFNAVLRNGISPTVVEGGKQFNVIPASAGAVLNVRTLPGHSIDKVVNRLRAIVSEPGVTIEITHRGEEAPASDPGSEMFASIAETAHELDLKMAVVPYLSTGVTDSARLRRLGVKAYGVLPFPMLQSDEERMHGHDERVPLESLHFGTRLIFGAVSRIAR